MDRLQELNNTLGRLSTDQSDVFKSFVNFAGTVKESGSLDTKTKELILVALGVGMQCEWCIATHVAGAVKAGCSKDEIIESCMMSVLMGGGPKLSYMNIVYEELDKYFDK